MLNKKHIIVPIICLISGYAIGYGRKPQPEIQIKEVLTIDKEKIENVIAEERERLKREFESKKSEKKTTVKITKPNGEVIEKTKEETKSSEKQKETVKKDKKESKETKEKEQIKKETEIVQKSGQSKYSLGLSAEKNIDKLFNTLPTDGLDYTVSLGLRVYGPLWLESGYQIKDKSVNLGIKLEF